MVNPPHWEQLYTSCTACDKWPCDILGHHCQYKYLILVKFNLFTFCIKKVEILVFPSHSQQVTLCTPWGMHTLVWRPLL